MRPLLAHKLKRRLRQAAVYYAYALLAWFVWALLSLALMAALPETGLIVSMLLLGALTMAAIVSCALWLRRITRIERRWAASNQQEVAWWLNATVALRRPAPLWETGMARLELLDAAWQVIVSERPNYVLELGSGLSTLVMAYALEEAGGGKLVALEDHRGYAERTRRMLADHGLHGCAQVVYVPIAALELEEGQHYWYSLDSLPDEMSIDMLLIDGPSGSLLREIRYPALPVLRRYLANGATILVDDTNRQRDQAIVERWIKRFPEIQIDPEASGLTYSVFRLRRASTGEGST